MAAQPKNESHWQKVARLLGDDISSTAGTAKDIVLNGLGSDTLGMPADIYNSISGLYGGDQLNVGTSDDIRNRLKANNITSGERNEGAEFASNFFSPVSAAKALGFKLAGMGALGSTVFHGSPFKFDKFDSKKINTGEGAQAYGHGLYLADSPQVAKGYSKMQPMIPVPPNRMLNGVELTPGTPEYHAGTLVEKSTLAKAKKDLARWINDKEGTPDTASMEGWKKSLETLNSVKNKSAFKVGKNENLYKVDLPDEQIAKMLDWDKPMGEQSAVVRKAWQSTKNKLSKNENVMADLNGDLSIMYGKDVTPLEFMNTWDIVADTNGAEKALSEAGISGVRYLDGISRSSGKGTSNYVVFPGGETNLKILERNKKPMVGLLEKQVEDAKKTLDTSFSPEAYKAYLKLRRQRDEATATKPKKNINTPTTRITPKMMLFSNSATCAFVRTD